MKLSEVKQLVMQARLHERERCAKIADAAADDWQRAYKEGKERGSAYYEGMADGGDIIANAIRKSEPPPLRFLRPETVAKNPELVTPETVVAGQALIDTPEGEKIVDRKRPLAGGTMAEQSLATMTGPRPYTSDRGGI